MQDPDEELNLRLGMLSVEESKSPSNLKMSLDLTSFSGAMLRHLADFAVYLRDPADKVSLTKAVRNFTSYGDFKDFETKGFELLRLHPNYVLAE